MRIADFDEIFGRDERTPDILPEAAIERLREVHERIKDGCPFKVGDLVMPRADAPINGHGDPHLVVGIEREAALYTGEARYWTHYTRSDVLFIVLHGHDIIPHGAPHWMLEPWKETGDAE